MVTLMSIKPTFLQVHSVSSKCVKQLAPPSSDSKVLAVQSWGGIPRKNPDETPASKKKKKWGEGGLSSAFRLG